MTTTSAPRRTQAQRREGTISALLEATVTCLTERGYAATSTAAVCAEAGLSQGALFRHFRAKTEGASVGTIDDVADVLTHLRAAVLSPTNQTWRELLVAARADAGLREALLPAREVLHAQMLDVAADLWADRLSADDLPAVLSIVVNMLDGLAFSALDPDPAAAPGRTAERALRLLAELIVHRYPEQEPR